MPPTYFLRELRSRSESYVESLITVTCGGRIDSKRSLVTANGPHARSESSSSSGPPEARDPNNGLAAGGAEMCMRRREASAARPRPVVPVEPTADGAASYSAVQLRRGPRAAHGPS